MSEDTPLKDVLLEITSKRLGVTGVVGAESALVGIITDGDLRRCLARSDGKADILGRKAAELMTRDPKTIGADSLAAEAVALMEKFSITSLFIKAEDSERPQGIIHLHDLLQSRHRLNPPWNPGPKSSGGRSRPSSCCCWTWTAC